MEQALHLGQRLASLLDALGLQRNPTKGFWEPCQFGRHLGVDIKSASGMFYAPAGKLNRPLGSSAAPRGTPGGSQFFLRELHSVVGDRWSGRVRMTPQLRRDLQWWTSVPSQSNGKPIHRPVETAYRHTDSSSYGWGGVLNGRLEARGFRSSTDERQHITWKELKSVRLAVESFLPHLAGRNVLMHEDNHASRFGPHSIDRFASALNTLLLRYNAAWLDPTCEAVDSLHLPDADWRRENNWCNAPWPLLPDLVQKLQRSGAAATVVAPRWEGKAWHQALTEMAAEELTVAPRAGLFRPGPRDGRGSFAPATAASYASCMKQNFRFYEEEQRPALAADPGTMARYATWLGKLGTIKASGLQPYLSAVNNFFKDHGQEPMALSNLGATTAAYVIGVTMQKIKYFGGWAMESSVANARSGRHAEKETPSYYF
eukprot:jgi/Tetstr1/457827/TSEL_044372.t1